MKKISVCKNQQIIFGHVVPTGAVYGKFTYTYDRRIITGYTYVYDKNNRQIFNKNGTPKMRAIIKEVPTKNTVMYSVESFHTFGSGNHMFAWILYENSSNWREIPLGDTPTTKALEELVRNYIKEHTLLEPAEPHVKTKNIESLTPKFRQANQFDPVFRMRPENTSSINEELKFNTHCSAASNLKKCHPIDERPMVTVKAKSPKLDKYVKYTRTVTVKGESGKEYTITEKITDTK